MKGSVIGFLVAGALLLAGAVAAVLGAQERIEAARVSEAWPTVEGVVVKISRTRGSGAHVRYRYTVAGVDHQSERVRLVAKLWGDTPSEILARYPKGQQVIVAFDPLDPASAVLEPGTSWGAVAKKMIGPLVLGIAALGLLWVGASGLRR